MSPWRLLTFWLGTSLLQAEVPKLEALFPAGGQVGTRFSVMAVGSLEAGARLFSDTPGLFFQPSGPKREWQVTVSAEVPLGLHLVHAVNAEGASLPRWFSVGHLPEISEVEPNDEVRQPQPLHQLPICVNARLDKSGDMDGYAVTLEAGQSLVAAVEAYALGSGVDMLAHVLDENGVRLYTASDSSQLDPVLRFQAPKTGRYVVQLAGFAHPPAADVRFTGGAAVVYRLHLSRGPLVTQILPAAVTLREPGEVELLMHPQEAKSTRHRLESRPRGQVGEVIQVHVPGALLPLQALVTAKAAMSEKEPNNTPDQAMLIQAGAVGGQLHDKADVDRFAIQMKKGESLQARVWAKRLGMSLDAQLKVEGPDGTLIRLADDQSEKMPDPELIWTAAVEGKHILTVEDLFHQGGFDKGYVLEISSPQPDFEVSLADAKPLVLEAGKSLSLKATVKRLQGERQPLVVRVSHLPPGVLATEKEVPEKGGEVELTLTAASNAPASGQTIGVEVWTKQAPLLFRSAIAPLRGENQRGISALDHSDRLWLTVK